MLEATSQGDVLFTWIVTCTTITTLIIILRFWGVWLTKRQLGPHDGLVVFAYIDMVIDAGFMIWAIVDGGLGKHAAVLTTAEMAVLNKLIFVTSIVWTLGNASAKLSVLLLYKNIFVGKTFERALYVIIALVSAYGIILLALFVSHCKPVSHFWHLTAPGSCRDISHEELASTSLSLIFDLIIILLPMPVLWRLQMTVYKRIVLTVMFSIGLITIGVMCWRIDVTVESTKPDYDFYFHLPTLALIVMLELWLSIIVACVPTLAPVMHTYVTPLVSKLSSRGSSGLLQTTPASSRETIGVKRSRKRYLVLGGSQDLLNTRFDGSTKTEVTSDNLAPVDVVPGGINMKKDIELRRF